MSRIDGDFQSVSSPFSLGRRGLICPVPLKELRRAGRTSHVITISLWLRENTQNPGAARCGSKSLQPDFLPSMKIYTKKYHSSFCAEIFHVKDFLRIYIFLLTFFQNKARKQSLYCWEEMPIVSYISVLLPLTMNASQCFHDIPRA